MESDKCMSFYLEGGSVRGHFCRLSDSITNALKLHNYPLQVNLLLAEMAAISQCFSMDIKSNSLTTMQLTGTSPVKLALVNSTDSTYFRCCASMNQEESQINLENLSIPQVFGKNGKLVFTIDFENQFYQTIVELTASTLQECLQHYFIQSQQIPTIVILYSSFVDKKIKSSAILLQKMPTTSNKINDESDGTWHDASCFAATLKSVEMLDDDIKMTRLIELVFGDLSPVVSRETNLEFKCNCTKEKIVNIIKSLSTEEEPDQDDSIEITCEYCSKKYTIDKKEID